MAVWDLIYVFSLALLVAGLWPGLWLIKWRGQRKLDKAHSTLELTFPRDLDLETAARVWTALSGVYGRVAPLKEPFGRGTLVFEVLSTPERLHYLFSFPPALKQTMEGKLTGAIRDIGIEETTAKLDYKWQCAVQLRRDSLMHDPDAKDPYKQRPVDPKLVEGLLRSTRGLGEGEAVMIQFVMTPTGRLRYDKYPEFWAVGRIAACAGHQDKKARRIRARQLVDDTLSSYRTLYVFSPGVVPGRLSRCVNGRHAAVEKWPGSYIPEELAVMCALPMGTPQVPGLVLGRRKFAPDVAISSTEDIVLGEAIYPSARRPLAISLNALTMNLHGLGPIGTGKTTLAKNMIVQGMRRGDGLAFFDPHGDATKELLDLVPKSRIDDVVLFDINDSTLVGYNPLAGDPYKAMGRMMAVADGLFDIYKMHRTADLLRNAILTLSYNGKTLVDIIPLLEISPEGHALRRQLAAKVPNVAVQTFWRRYNSLRPGEQGETTEPLHRRLRALMTWPSLRACLGQTRTTFSVRDILADNKILLVCLAKGEGQKEPLYLTGSLLMAELWDEIQARVRLDVDQRSPFIVYLDEFPNWIKGLTDFSEVLNENRKYGAGFVLLHQQMSQIEKIAVRDAVAMATRSTLCFQTGYIDAAGMAREFGKPVTAEDIQDLGPREAIVRLLAGDYTTGPATIRTLPPPEPEEPDRRRAAAVRAASQARYGRPMEDVLYELDQAEPQTLKPRPEPSTGPEEDW